MHRSRIFKPIHEFFIAISAAILLPASLLPIKTSPALTQVTAYDTDSGVHNDSKELNDTAPSTEAINYWETI